MYKLRDGEITVLVQAQMNIKFLATRFSGFFEKRMAHRDAAGCLPCDRSSCNYAYKKLKVMRVIHAQMG